MLSYTLSLQRVVESYTTQLCCIAISTGVYIKIYDIPIVNIKSDIRNK